MTEELTAKQAIAKLRNMAADDEDLTSLLREAYRQRKMTPGELAEADPEFVLELYDSVIEMFADVDAMETADKSSRDRMARVKWGHE